MTSAPLQTSEVYSVRRTTPATESSLTCRIVSSWATAISVCLLVWLVMRIVFFFGIQGSDDLFHMRYAALWDRAPANHWESRLLANVLMAGAMKLFGRTGWAAALPSMTASFVILGCVLYWCYRYADIRHAWWGGLFAAVCPIDVYDATTPSAYPLMTAFLTLGTLAFLQSAESRKARFLAALSLSLGVVTHLSGVYYVASLVVAALWIDRRRFRWSVATVLAASVLVMAIDMSVFQFAFGDALGRFRLAWLQTLDEKTQAPLYHEIRSSWASVMGPLQQLIFTKDFGLALGVVLAWGTWRYRRLSEPARMLLVVSVVFWLWMNYGSQVPWAYKPFWRIGRYLAPHTLTVSVLFACAVAGARRRVPASIGAAVVLAICPLNLAAGGSWGQSVETSRELLAWAVDHPKTRCVADLHTINEMYVLNGMRLPANVVTTNESRLSHLICRDAARIPIANLQPSDAILENPLNVSRAPLFAEFLRAHAGALRYESAPTYRMVCRLVPILQRYSWSIRKPSARVLDCVGGKSD